MIEDTHQCRLNNGEKMKIVIARPPLKNYSSELYWWGKTRERVAMGELKEYNIDRFFIGEVNGEVAGSMVSIVPRDTGEVGIVGFVKTNSEHRRKGVASRLLKDLIRVFVSEGGIALYLCTINPHAYRLYGKAGFKRCIGDGMRYINPEYTNFDEAFLAYQGKANIREVKWSDLAKFAPLFNSPNNHVFIKDYSIGIYSDIRFEGHFNGIMLEHEENEGIVLVMENDASRVVGACHITRVKNFHEQHVGIIDFMTAPDYISQGEELLSEAIEKADFLDMEFLINKAASCDKQKVGVFQKSGFNTEITIKNYFKVGSKRADLITNVLELKPKGGFQKTRSSYYGCKPEWLS